MNFISKKKYARFKRFVIIWRTSHVPQEKNERTVKNQTITLLKKFRFPNFVTFHIQFQKCKTIADIFELVKASAAKYLNMEQAGLMVGLADLGEQPDGFVGAFYSLNANAIILNNNILQNILSSNPTMYKPFVFYVLLHEYVHSLGFYDEMQTRQLTYEISMKLGHTRIVEFSTNIEKYFPNLILSEEIEPAEDVNIDFIPGIDRKNTNYIM